MRRVILLEHVSLDGYLAGPEGEMDWINTDDDVWHYVHPVLDGVDTVIWGRVTYKMMEEYWPTAPDRPDATQHDVALSKSLTQSTWPNTRVLHGIGS